MLVAGVWFIAVLWTTLRIWGLEPLVFPTPDEATNRLAALLIRRSGSPNFPLPFPDPENLAHLRPWRAVGEHAIPIYPPLTFYAYGLLSHLGKLGYLSIAMLPASGAAAFAAGTARLLPAPRRWLALSAPALGFPGLYWLLRPWMNLSLLLVCLCWSLFFWARWRRQGSKVWLAAGLFASGIAAAVRPDYAAYLLSAALCFSIAKAPSQIRLISGLVVSAGALAVGINLGLNQLVTGGWRAAYLMVVDATPGESSHGPLQLARLLLFPGGFPASEDAYAWFVRYWLQMGPAPLLLLAQLTLVPLLHAEAWPARFWYSAGLLVVFFLVLTRMYAGFSGALDPVGLVNHSIPRYWAPVYLFAALPPLIFLGRCRATPVLIAGVTLTFALAVLSVREISTQQPTSLRYLAGFVHKKTLWLESLARIVPADAIVYTEKEDKVVWSRWRAGVIRNANATASSIKRALSAGRPVFILQRHFPRSGRPLLRAMKREHLVVVGVDARAGLYRVEPAAPEAE